LLEHFKADLHIHTCLSPCTEWEMSPKKIVERSLKKDLDIIAICDHNSVENAGAAIRSVKSNPLCVIPGMEICSKEEVHVLALFGELEQALVMQQHVYSHLPGQNEAKVFGYQIIADENDEVLGESSRLLIGATELGLQEIVTKARSLGGVTIASHVDRPAFGIIGKLGFIPDDLRIDGVEISYRIPLKTARDSIPGIKDFPCVTSSDAHHPDDIGRAWTSFLLAAPTVEEIRLALKGEKGRKVEI